MANFLNKDHRLPIEQYFHSSSTVEQYLHSSFNYRTNVSTLISTSSTADILKSIHA